jgi:hypothetical protein
MGRIDNGEWIIDNEQWEELIIDNEGNWNS